MGKMVEVTHGRGPVTVIVGRGQTVEVEWDDSIEQLVDEGRLTLVGRKPYKRKKKDVAEDTAEQSGEVAEGFTGALTDTGEFTAEPGADWMGD